MEDLCINESIGPTGSLAQAAMDLIEECNGCVPGEKIKLPYLEPKYGFNVIEITVVEMPELDDDLEELYGDLNTQAVVRLTVHCALYNLMEGSGTPELKVKLTKWLTDENSDDMIKLLDFEVGTEVGADMTKEIKATIAFESYEILGGDESCILESPFKDNFWNLHMNQVITEGVCYSNQKVPARLRDSLRRNLDKLAKETPVDYHPNSNDIVRDLVHPALFSYIEKVSKFKKGKSKKDITSPPEYKEHDFWGRKYESSKFQWLPTIIKVSEEGKCSFAEYINNLDREKFPELHSDLEKLFEVFLPYFQEVWSYAKAMKFWNEQADDDADDREDLVFEKETVNFNGTELQVIPKIVEYKLKPGQEYEGVWHAEGMSHENIVMTGIYFIDRDPGLLGADLKFKRSFHVAERSKMLFGVPQTRSIVANDFACEGLMPLGHFKTREGFMLVFPNCHVHKIGKLINESHQEARRRIIVFFFINPEKRIISTREIAPQQDVIPLAAARKYRLDLMAERKFDKEKLNIRDIELCEH